MHPFNIILIPVFFKTPPRTFSLDTDNPAHGDRLTTRLWMESKTVQTNWERIEDPDSFVVLCRLFLSTQSATWQDFIRQPGEISFGNLADGDEDIHGSSGSMMYADISMPSGRSVGMSRSCNCWSYTIESISANIC